MRNGSKTTSYNTIEVTRHISVRESKDLSKKSLLR